MFEVIHPFFQFWMNSLQSYHVSLKFLIQVPDPKVESVSEVTSAEPEHELMIDTTSPPDEITKRAEELIKYVKGEKRAKVVTEKSVSSIDLWDFAGQQLYYASNPVFLTSRAIYILVCNLSNTFL